MLIKKISDKDINLIYKIGLQEFKEKFWFTKKFLKETLEIPGYYYGAFEKSKLVGAILVEKIERPKLWIYFLAVDKNYRGRGIGSKLLKKIEKHCSKHHPMIFVDTAPYPYKTNRFYLKNGFKKQAKIKDWFGINQEGVIYSKKVIKFKRCHGR